ncbi:CACNA2D2 [Branchiostoma lanceolatum]|uniref:CACNA2D2 protein n=1 Tax=Branchiostoma lanceolatum TaxID=7740 RepID=A0A8J9ZH34_BRALA|nr:CACNA2D2 [Branchiostoma lanceolatum]
MEFSIHRIQKTVVVLICATTFLFARPSCAVDRGNGQDWLWEGYSYNDDYYSYERDEGTITGDVQNWATMIENYFIQLATDGLKTSHIQKFYDQAGYAPESKDGNEIVRTVQEALGDYFSKKEAATRRIAEAVVQFHDEAYLKGQQDLPILSDLPLEIYRDADIPSRLPTPLKFSTYFKQHVNTSYSVVKISDEVPRDDNATVNTVVSTSGLDEVFRNNSKEDPLLRWQYFGSSNGLLRLYPGREWDTNFAGFYNDYDPRIRPWYIAATSGAKDVVVVLDCSHSMIGEKFDIAKAVSKTILNTLTKQDFVNVVCARASHWDETGRWHQYDTEVLSCQQNRLVPASTAHRKDLIQKIDGLQAGGTSEMKKGFEIAFELLSTTSRTTCQSLIVMVTDGKDMDGAKVRCGPGYYTRSGYVPGPKCRYDWRVVWDRVAELQETLRPKARIFSYLTVDDGEEFPGKLACDNRGSMKKLFDTNNIISQMENYFDFLSANVQTDQGRWTAPYLDAWGLGLMVTFTVPAISKITNKAIGVAGVDATLEEIENILVNDQWGSVYTFLINNEGETIFHPLLRPSTQLVDDPIFIPIRQLEMPNGKPEKFLEVEEAMKRGKRGSLYIKDAIRGIPKGDFQDGVKVIVGPATYYYTALNDSVYAFAFNLADTDKNFRHPKEPKKTPKIPNSYYNLLTAYNDSSVRGRFQEAWESLDVKFNERRYPKLYVSYEHSTFRLAPKCYCNPNEFLFDVDMAEETVDAHMFMNSNMTDEGCPNAKYEKNIRADVLITSQIEEIWRDRDFGGLGDVKWTYIGCRSGVFRTYPGHRSRRTYDPTGRPWYHRAITNPQKITISNAYLDAAGVGKVVTLSRAIFEGMPIPDQEECENATAMDKKLPGGCHCERNGECLSDYCYISESPGTNKHLPRCASDKVQAVGGLDILYNDFHEHIYGMMQSSDFKKSCGQNYTCPNGEPGCQTRCYLFDNFANLVTDQDFLSLSNLDEREYHRVSLGRKEGEVMMELIYKHKFFERKEQIDFQGACSVSPYSPKVTLEGIPTTPRSQDDYFRNKGPIPKFSNEFGCIQDVVGFLANVSALGPTKMIMGNISGPCTSGFYYVIALPRTNLFLLVIENWTNHKESLFYNFNCRIQNRIADSGAFRIINGTCAHTDDQNTLARPRKCPIVKDINIPCSYNTGTSTHFSFTVMIMLSTFTWIYTLIVDT